MTVLGGPVDGLRLHADSLLSKWGFNDGTLPDELLDWLEQHDEPAFQWAVWEGMDELVGAWGGVLLGLVWWRLLPVLDHRVAVADLGGPHNPVRAALVDGAGVSGLWGDPRAPRPRLTPASVLVPWADVWAELQTAMAARTAAR